MTIRSLPVSLLLALVLLPTESGQAASILSFTVTQGHRKAVQTVNIQGGQVWVTAAGGDPNMDVIYDRASEHLVLIDHGRQRYTPVNEDTVGKLTSQVETMTPLLRGLSGQIRQLKPEQRAKWEGMLNGIPLDAFDQAQKELASAKLTPTGKSKTIAGVRCEALRLSAGHIADLEFCLAQPDALGLSAEDADTLKGLTAFTQRLTRKAHGLASRFGLAIGQSDLDRLSGIPIQIKEPKGKQALSMTLDRAQRVTTPLKPLAMPDSYKADRLRLW